MKRRFFQIAFFFFSFVAVFWSCTSDPSITDVNAIRTPSIATTPVLEISTNTATAGGVLSDNGNSVILSRGVCYSETPNPTIEDFKVVNPGFIGSFDCILTGLTANRSNETWNLRKSEKMKILEIQRMSMSHEMFSYTPTS